MGKQGERALLKIPYFGPLRCAHKVRVPTLVIAGSNDTIVSAAAARKAAERLRGAEFVVHASNHFEPYYGRHLDINVQLQLSFLRKHLTGSSAEVRNHDKRSRT